MKTKFVKSSLVEKKKGNTLVVLITKDAEQGVFDNTFQGVVVESSNTEFPVGHFSKWLKSSFQLSEKIVILKNNAKNQNQNL